MTFIPETDILRGSFGESIVSQKTPIVQIDNKYKLSPTDLPADTEVFTATGGIADNNENKFRCQSGVSIGGFGVIRSRETLNYHAGQGIEGMITASFTAGVVNSLQFAGMFNLTDILAFGFDGTDFSCIHDSHGSAEMQVITVTVTGAGTCTVKLNGDSVGITVTNSDIETNAEELRAGLEADGTLSSKWQFEQLDSRVFCIAEASEVRAGVYSVVGGVTASISQGRAGTPRVSANIPQASWSDSIVPFASFDPININVYRIRLGYLGAANIEFAIYDPGKGDFVVVHTIEWASTSKDTHISSPNLKVGWVSASLGSTTNLTVEGGSAALFLEGEDGASNDVHATINTKAGVGTTSTNIVTLKSRTVQGDQFNLGKIRPIRVSFSLDHNKGSIIEIRKNATVAGVINYQAQSENKSIAAIDIAGTTVTNGEIIDGFTVAAGGSATVDLVDLKVKLLPTDTLTIAARTVLGTSTDMSVVLTFKEEK